MVKYVESLQGEEVGLIRLYTKRIVIKIVESRIASIQKMDNNYYIISIKKGNVGFMGRLNDLQEKPNLVPLEFYPIMSKNEREYKLIRQSNILPLF